MALAALIVFIPACPGFVPRTEAIKASLAPWLAALIKLIFSLLCLILSILALATTDYTPFIYFRF